LITPKPEAKKEWQEQLKDNIGVTRDKPWQKKLPRTGNRFRCAEF
jgi:hypothetical protein